MKIKEMIAYLKKFDPESELPFLLVNVDGNPSLNVSEIVCFKEAPCVVVEYTENNVSKNYRIPEEQITLDQLLRKD